MLIVTPPVLQVLRFSQIGWGANTFQSVSRGTSIVMCIKVVGGAIHSLSFAYVQVHVSSCIHTLRHEVQTEK